MIGSYYHKWRGKVNAKMTFELNPRVSTNHLDFLGPICLVYSLSRIIGDSQWLPVRGSEFFC